MKREKSITRRDKDGEYESSASVDFRGGTGSWESRYRYPPTFAKNEGPTFWPGVCMWLSRDGPRSASPPLGVASV
jgi:hypothetical protein